MKEYKCGHCGYKGPCYGNGYSATWCHRCQRNDGLTLITQEAPKDTSSDNFLTGMLVGAAMESLFDSSSSSSDSSSSSSSDFSGGGGDFGGGGASGSW